MFEKILNLLYPRTCGFCGEISKESLCKKCELKIKKYQINLIRKSKTDYFDEVCSVFKYEDIIRDVLIKYKFHNKAYLYKTFVEVILKNKKICGFLKKYDIIISVPISKERKKQRGYNQSELVANEVARKLNIKIEKKVLKKHVNAKPQSELSKAERKSNIKNVFKVQNLQKINNMNILIFDDIYTTGSTVNECAKILKQFGANKVGVLTIAKD